MTLAIGIYRLFWGELLVQEDNLSHFFVKFDCVGRFSVVVNRVFAADHDIGFIVFVDRDELNVFSVRPEESKPTE